MDIFFFYVYDEESATTVPVQIDEQEIISEELEFYLDDKIRRIWHAQSETLYLSIIDVIAYLTDSSAPKKYWSKLKRQLSDEGFETSTISRRFKLKAADGKMRFTDCATTEQILRIIQSIPSKRAEPFKQWLAAVGSERLDEMADPEKAIERAVLEYRKKGYSDAWITQRLRAIEIRKEMTDEWYRSGISDQKDFATLTNILTQAWSGKSVQQYKKLKNLKKENLRDNITNTELALNLLAEVSTTELSKNANPKGFKESKKIAIAGGNIAGNARKDLEQQLGRSVISPSNASTPDLLDET